MDYILCTLDKIKETKKVNKHIIQMKYIRSNSFKKLFSIKLTHFNSHHNRHQEKEVEENNDGDQNDTKSSSSKTISSPKKPTWKCYSYEDIFDATNGFSSSNLVGKGGYAEVYRGNLKNGETVAVKRLTNSSSSTDEKKEREFLTEIGTIGHVFHPNVSSLVGCCIDNGLYLIFHFSSRGSVASVLHDDKLPTMDWNVRYKIAIGAARGLDYLHRGCQRRIIHRDIKASNILLTSDFEPQISDFGLAKWLPSQWTHHSIVSIEGTFGYLAPEYFMHGIAEEKTDVFAFGVFLLELISGRKPVDESHQCLHSWAKSIIKEGKIKELVDSRLRDQYSDAQLKRIAFVASLCIRTSSSWRPTMIEVLEILMEEEIDEERWSMANGEEEQEEFGGLEYLDELERECFFSTPSLDSVSTKSI